MDNRIFNVNGRLERDRGGEDLLLAALRLVFNQSNLGRPRTCKSYKITKSGIVLAWTDNARDVAWQKLPGPMTAEQCLPLVLSYLHSDAAKECELPSWDEDYDHDGHNGPGWRVYCEDWGHVAGEWCAICAVKPAFMWYGK